MNIHKEDDFIWITPNDKIWKIELDGSLALADKDDIDDQVAIYKAHDNFYIHSGQEEWITYNTVAPDGRILEVNKFKAVFPNPGIKRVNGTKG